MASLLGGSHYPIDLNPDRSVGSILEIRNSDSTTFKDTDQKPLISGQLMLEMIQYCGKRLRMLRWAEKHVLDSREKEKAIFSMQLILKGKGEEESIPLCVDVDGTLLKPDLRFESFLQLIKQKPWLLPCVPVWLIQGKAYLKQQLEKHASVLGTQLPMHPGLLDFLRSENENGRAV